MECVDGETMKSIIDREKIYVGKCFWTIAENLISYIKYIYDKKLTQYWIPNIIDHIIISKDNSVHVVDYGEYLCYTQETEEKVEEKVEEKLRCPEAFEDQTLMLQGDIVKTLTILMDLHKIKWEKSRSYKTKFLPKIIVSDQKQYDATSNIKGKESEESRLKAIEFFRDIFKEDYTIYRSKIIEMEENNEIDDTIGNIINKIQQFVNLSDKETSC